MKWYVYLFIVCLCPLGIVIGYSIPIRECKELTGWISLPTIEDNGKLICSYKGVFARPKEGKVPWRH